MLYLNGKNSSIEEIINKMGLTNPDRVKKEKEKYRVKNKVFTCLEKDISIKILEGKGGKDSPRLQVPTSIGIQCVYSMDKGGELLEIRYVESTRRVKGGGPDEVNYFPTHVFIDHTGVKHLNGKNGRDAELIFFLMNHPNNLSNELYAPKSEITGYETPPGLAMLFQEFAPVNRAQKELLKIRIADSIKARIIGNDVQQAAPESILRATAKQIVDATKPAIPHSFYDVDNQDISEIQFELIRIAMADPERMNGLISSWENDVAVVVDAAKAKGLIVYDMETKNWMLKSGSKKTRLMLADGEENPDRQLITWLLERDKDKNYAKLAKAMSMEVEELS